MIDDAVVELCHPSVPQFTLMRRVTIHHDDDSLVFVLLVDVVSQNL
jgi:hypothetical protein